MIDNTRMPTTIKWKSVYLSRFLPNTCSFVFHCVHTGIVETLDITSISSYFHFLRNHQLMFELIVTITTCSDAISTVLSSSSRLRCIVYTAHTMCIKMYVASNYTLSMTCVSSHFIVTFVCGDLFVSLWSLCFVKFSMSFALNTKHEILPSFGIGRVTYFSSVQCSLSASAIWSHWILIGELFE